MKSISILTLLSASLVAAAPAPFVGTGPVVAAGTENVVIPTTNFGRREEAIVQDFGKRALKLRGALLAARGVQGNGDAVADAANAEDAAAAAGDQAQLGQDAQDNGKGKGKGKGKNADGQAGMILRFPTYDPFTDSDFSSTTGCRRATGRCRPAGCC